MSSGEAGARKWKSVCPEAAALRHCVGSCRIGLIPCTKTSCNSLFCGFWLLLSYSNISAPTTNPVTKFPVSQFPIARRECLIGSAQSGSWLVQSHPGSGVIRNKLGHSVRAEAVLTEVQVVSLVDTPKDLFQINTRIIIVIHKYT